MRKGRKGALLCKGPLHSWSSTRLAGLGGGGCGGGRGREALLGGAWAQRSLINLSRKRTRRLRCCRGRGGSGGCPFCCCTP